MALGCCIHSMLLHPGGALFYYTCRLSRPPIEADWGWPWIDMYPLNPCTSWGEPCSIIHVGFPGPLLRLIKDGLRLLYPLNATTSWGEPCSIIHVGFPGPLLRLFERGCQRIERLANDMSTYMELVIHLLRSGVVYYIRLVVGIAVGRSTQSSALSRPHLQYCSLVTSFTGQKIHNVL
jgi:hypothetical protein